MRNYTSELDEKFVCDLVSAFLTKNWHAKYITVKKHGQCWKVNYKINDGHYVFLLDNFTANFGTNHMWCSALDKVWQAALYCKFGEEYYLELNKYLIEQSKSKNKDQQERAMGELKAIKAIKEKEDVKNTRQ